MTPKSGGERGFPGGGGLDLRGDGGSLGRPGGGFEEPRHSEPRVADFDGQSSGERASQDGRYRLDVAATTDIERVDSNTSTRRQEVEAAVARIET